MHERTFTFLPLEVYLGSIEGKRSEFQTPTLETSCKTPRVNVGHRGPVKTQFTTAEELHTSDKVWSATAMRLQPGQVLGPDGRGMRHPWQ